MDRYRVSLRLDMAGLGYDLLSLELVGFDYTDSASEFQLASPKVDSLHLKALKYLFKYGPYHMGVRLGRFDRYSYQDLLPKDFYWDLMRPFQDSKVVDLQ